MLSILTFSVLSFLELKQIRKKNPKTKEKALKERQISDRAGADVDAQYAFDSVLISGAHPYPSSLPLPFPPCSQELSTPPTATAPPG